MSTSPAMVDVTDDVDLVAFDPRPLHGRRLSSVEYMALPETNLRMELVDGEVYVSPSATIVHQSVVRRLMRALDPWADEHPPAFVACAPLDVRFGSADILQPDLLVVLQGVDADSPLPLTLVPDLVVEVLSSRPSRDRVLKRRLYAEAGVPEYWMVDPKRRCVDVVVAGTLRRVVDRVDSVACPGLVVDVAALFLK